MKHPHKELLMQYLDDTSVEFERLQGAEYEPCAPITVLCNHHHAFRIKSTSDQIDWSHVHPDYKWMARDEDGEAYVYDYKPKTDEDKWDSGMRCVQTSAYSSYKRGTCDWKDSLVKRPEGV